MVRRPAVEKHRFKKINSWGFNTYMTKVDYRGYSKHWKAICSYYTDFESPNPACLSLDYHNVLVIPIGWVSTGESAGTLPVRATRLKSD